MGLFSDSEIEKNQKVRQSLTGTMTRKLKDIFGKCEICKRKGGLDVHHLKPVSKGGTNVSSNLVVLCPNCHRDCHNGTISQSDLKKIISRRSDQRKKALNKVLRSRNKVEGREVQEKGLIERIFG